MSDGESRTSSGIEELKQILLSSSNPFSSAVVHSAWDEISDVPSINKNPFEDILHVIRKVQGDPHKKAEMMLLLGEVGLGKTHLLSRLRMSANQENFYYIQVEPVPDIDKIHMHILREIIGNLSRVEKGVPFTFLDRMLAKLFTEKIYEALERAGRDLAIIEKLRADPTELFDLHFSKDEFETLQYKVLRRIVRENPGMDINFLQVLFKLIDPQSKQYFSALKWLQCETLTENERIELGVGESLSDEMRAAGALKSILQISDRVMVFGFDQIEGIFQRFGLDGLKTFLQTLAVIYNGIPNHISLISCQSQIWVNFVIKNLDKSISDRISAKTDLENLAEQDVLDLVGVRMNSVWIPHGISPSTPIFPFTKDYLLEIAANTGWNPRSLLIRLRDQFKEMQARQSLSIEIQPPTIKPPEVTWDTLSTFLVTQYEEIEKENYTQYIRFLESKQQDMIKAVFYQLFSGFTKSKNPPIGVKHVTMNVTLVKTQKPIDLVIEFQNEAQTTKVGCAFNFSPNMVSVFHSLRRLIAGRDNQSFDWTIPFRGRYPISQTASKTQIELSKVLSTGILITIDNTEGSKLYAIKKLLDSVSAEEVVFGEDPVSYDDAMEIVIEAITPRLTPFQELITFVRNKIGPITSHVITPEQERPESLDDSQILDLTEKAEGIIRKEKVIHLEELIRKLELQKTQTKSFFNDILSKMESKGQISLERDENDVIVLTQGFFNEEWRIRS